MANLQIPSSDTLISLSFQWKGFPTNINHLDLIVDNAATGISIRIPNQSSTYSTPFLHRKYSLLFGKKTLMEQTESEVYKISAEKIQKLSLQVGIIKTNPTRGTLFMEPSGFLKHKPDTYICKETIPIQIAEKIDPTQPYQIVCSVKDDSLRAELFIESTEDLNDEKPQTEGKLTLTPTSPIKVSN